MIVAIMAVVVLLAPPMLVKAPAANQPKPPQLRPITVLMTRLTWKPERLKPFSEEGPPQLGQMSEASSKLRQWSCQRRSLR